MEFTGIRGADSGGWRPRISPTAALIILFWISQFGFLTLQRHLRGITDPHEVLYPRMIMSLISILISFGINWLTRRQSGRGWGVRLWLALGFAVAGAVAHSILNFIVFQIALPTENWNDYTLAFIFAALVAWLWMYSAMSALLLAGAYSDEARERERRLAEWQALAHAAQMRALRYQLNPHFMFNTLNSIASLISSGKAAPAEQMVENLSDFLRAGLALDPADDLTLERELELQSLYLAIEAIRFADRLRIEIDLPDDLRDVRVPSLILQPIVENAVKHGVARSDAAVTVAIAARRDMDRLILTVRNGVNGTPVKPGGTGIGLSNAARRLELRYGEACDFHAGLESGAVFAVRFSIPIQRSEG
ncbi:MAG: histidine kinase [Pseudomonadota bacterium]